MKITDKYVFFWKEHPFCNFTKCKIKFLWPDSPESEAIYFNSSEQYFMYSKALFFHDTEIAEEILKASTPEEARRLGRKVKNYDESSWDKVRVDLMYNAVSKKFIQNKKLRDQLCDPKYDGKEFVEAAFYDRIWGIGYDEEDALFTPSTEWGRNELGKILNRVRDWCIEHKDILN